MAQSYFYPFEHVNIRYSYLVRPSSCAVALRVNSVLARNCFDLICALTPATVCWTRWKPGTLSSSSGGTESASWSSVPGQSARSWLCGGIHFNQVISRAHCCLPTQSPPPLHKAPAGPLLQATREKPGPAFHSGLPIRAVMLIVPPWQHVAQWMQLSCFWGRDSSSGRDRWRRTMMVMSEYCRESKRKQQGGGTWLTGRQEGGKMVSPDKRWSA